MMTVLRGLKLKVSGNGITWRPSVDVEHLANRPRIAGAALEFPLPLPIDRASSP
jgi:hypothetical protein